MAEEWRCMSTPEERVRTYRSRAEEIRTAADGMRHADSQATFLRIARDYDLMADTLEGKITLELRRKSQRS
jgi:hypothetical protein